MGKERSLGRGLAAAEVTPRLELAEDNMTANFQDSVFLL